jgi:hypothetical protein
MHIQDGLRLPTRGRTLLQLCFLSLLNLIVPVILITIIPPPLPINSFIRHPFASPFLNPLFHPLPSHHPHTFLPRTPFQLIYTNLPPLIRAKHWFEMHLHPTFFFELSRPL